MKLKKKEKILIIVAAAGLVIFLVQNLLVSGLKEKMKQANQRIKLEEEKLKQGRTIEKDKDRIKKEFQDYSEFLKIESQDREIVAKFLKEIESITQKSGILVLNLTPENQPEEVQGVKKFRADLKAEGSMDQVFNFFYSIQDSKLLIKLDKIMITSKDESGSVLRVETTISISVL